MVTSTEVEAPRALVVDCSISLSWFLPDEQNDIAQRILARLSRLEVWVPFLWRLELANGLNLALRRGRIDAAYRKHTLESAELLPISVDLVLPSLTAIAELAEQHRLTAYDAAYLELALRRKLPLATLDAELAAAASAHGLLYSD